MSTYICFRDIKKTYEMDEMMFGREIYGSSYINAVILTFMFAILVNVMIELLKSVE